MDQKRSEPDTKENELSPSIKHVRDRDVCVHPGRQGKGGSEAMIMLQGSGAIISAGLTLQASALSLTASLL